MLNSDTERNGRKIKNWIRIILNDGVYFTIYQPSYTSTPIYYYAGKIVNRSVKHMAKNELLFSISTRIPDSLHLKSK